MLVIMCLGFYLLVLSLCSLSFSSIRGLERALRMVRLALSGCMVGDGLAVGAITLYMWGRWKDLPERMMRMWLVVIDSGIEVVGRVMAYLWMRLRDSELGRYEGYYGVFRDYG
jgi:hypothetical protein